MLYDRTCTTARQDHESRDMVQCKERKSQTLSNAASNSWDLPDVLDNDFPKEVQGKSNDEAPGSWLQAISPLRQKHSLLDLALTALSMVRLGRYRGDKRLQAEGVAKYGKVLKDLQSILTSDSLALEEQNLASCMTLTIFEVCHPNILYM